MCIYSNRNGYFRFNRTTNPTHDIRYSRKMSMSFGASHNTIRGEQPKMIIQWAFACIRSHSVRSHTSFLWVFFPSCSAAIDIMFVLTARKTPNDCWFEFEYHSNGLHLFDTPKSIHSHGMESIERYRFAFTLLHKPYIFKSLFLKTNENGWFQIKVHEYCNLWDTRQPPWLTMKFQGKNIFHVRKQYARLTTSNSTVFFFFIPISI